jgi:hypothetical protein
MASIAVYSRDIGRRIAVIRKYRFITFNMTVSDRKADVVDVVYVNIVT